MNLQKLKKLEQYLSSYRSDPVFPDDHLVHITCLEALEAAKEGNFGVGALIIDETNKIIEQGHNRVFSPHFRSDLHAEMVVLSEFEEKQKGLKNVNGFTLYSSLEPCPMCLCRLITSGFKKVLYASTDPTGGMVTKMDKLPDEWKMIARGRHYGLADCSQGLKGLAQEIFSVTAQDLDQKLAMR